jgi:hypothetical protein
LSNCPASSALSGQRVIHRIEAIRSRMSSARVGAKPPAPPGGSFCAVAT